MHDPGTRATPRALGSTLALATRRRRGYILPRQPGPAAAAAQGPRSSSRSPQPWDHVLHAPTGTQARGPRHSRSPRPSVLAAGAPACPHGGPAARTAAMPRLLGPHPHVRAPRPITTLQRGSFSQGAQQGALHQPRNEGDGHWVLGGHFKI